MDGYLLFTTKLPIAFHRVGVLRSVVLDRTVEQTQSILVQPQLILVKSGQVFVCFFGMFRKSDSTNGKHLYALIASNPLSYCDRQLRGLLVMIDAFVLCS